MAAVGELIKKGNKLFQQKNEKEALKIFQECLPLLSPEDKRNAYNIQCKMGLCLMRTEDPRGACTHFNNARRIYPDSSLPLLYRIDAYARTNTLPAAFRDLAEVFEREPDNKRAWALLGELESKALKKGRDLAYYGFQRPEKPQKATPDKKEKKKKKRPHKRNKDIDFIAAVELAVPDDGEDPVSSNNHSTVHTWLCKTIALLYDWIFSYFFFFN